MVYIFAGNIFTGEVIYELIPDSDKAIDDMLDKIYLTFGCGNYVWRIYNTAQSVELREIQFNNYLARFMEDIA